VHSRRVWFNKFLCRLIEKGKKKQTTCNAAYVVFSRAESAKKAINAYSDDWLFRCLMPRRLRFRGRGIRVVQAPVTFQPHVKLLDI
jgi:hypothetical protein